MGEIGAIQTRPERSEKQGILLAFMHLLKGLDRRHQTLRLRA